MFGRQFFFIFLHEQQWVLAPAVMADCAAVRPKTAQTAEEIVKNMKIGR